jgi:phospho-N-acetylmuramoyl-pentapeptide-transferase
MLLSLAQWLQTLSPDYGAFRVFQYLTFRAVMAAVTALLIGLLAGPGDPAFA